MGANWGRAWLSPHWTTFALEPKKLGQIDLGNAWRLDYALDLACRQGVRLQLCIDSYNVLRDHVSWPEWERSPHHLLLKRPTDFWTDPEAQRLYRNKLRYLVARWGAYTSTMAWEFWNEVDGVAEYKLDPIRAWHSRMADYLHRIDPYGHPVTTSYGGSGEGAGDRSVFQLKGIDFTQSHRYDDPDIAMGVLRAQDRLGALGKPHFVGEVGADARVIARRTTRRATRFTIPYGRALPLVPRAARCPGGGIRTSRLATSTACSVRSLGSRRESPSIARAFIRKSLKLSLPTGRVTVRDAIPATDGVGWQPAPYNAPQTIIVDEKGMRAPRLARVQQGMGNHRELHNPVTFETDLPRPTTLVIAIGDVSGYGGAALRVARDGETVVTKAFTDPDGDRDTATLKQFAQRFGSISPPGVTARSSRTLARTGSWRSSGSSGL